MVRITARHFTLNDEMKKLIDKKYKKLEKFKKHILDSEIILTRDAEQFIVEGIVRLKRENFVAKTKNKELKVSVQDVINKLMHQMQKYEDKLTDKKL